MDYETIIVAVLALIGTLVGSFLSNSKNSALIAYRLEQLEDKVQKHNNLIERMTVLEKDVQAVSSKLNAEEQELKHLKEEQKNG